MNIRVVERECTAIFQIAFSDIRRNEKRNLKDCGAMAETMIEAEISDDFTNKER